MEGIQTVSCENASHSEWASMERYRLDVVSAWPPSPYKDATLAAIHSALASLQPKLPVSPGAIRFAPEEHGLPLAA